MTQTTAGMMYFAATPGVAGREIINEERTRHYQVMNPRWTGNNCDACGCPPLQFDPYTGSTIAWGSKPSTGASKAPWYQAAAPATDEFLGFVVTDVIGLDYSLVNRTVAQRAGDGSNISPFRMNGREITFTLLGTALTEQGMRLGLDWLAQQLIRMGMRCSTGRLLLKLFCPDYLPASPALAYQGANVELREVSLVTGPAFTSNFLEGAGELVREIMFTVVAADPCFYTRTYTALGPTNYGLPGIPLNLICTNSGITVAHLICGPVESSALPLNSGSPCAELPPFSPLDSTAAVVTIQMVGGTTGPFMVEAYGYPSGHSCAEAVQYGVLLGRVGIDTLTGTQGVLVDGVSQVIFSRASSGAEWLPDDSLLLFPDAEFPFFPRMTGWGFESSLYVAVRPYYVCSSSDRFEVTIQSQSIFGCPL